MRPPRTALASAAAAVLVAAATIAGTGSAQADLGVPSTLPTVPPVPLPTLPVPLPSVPVPAPSVSLPTTLPTPGLPTGGSGGGSGSSGSGGGGPAAGSPGGSAAAGTSDGAAAAGGPVAAARRNVAAKRKADATPMIAGTPDAANLVDDESSPQLYSASQSFLAADQGIAEIARQKRVMARLKQDAARTAQLYRSMGYDIAGAQRVAAEWHARDAALGSDVSAAARQVVGDSATRADERLGELIVGREVVKAEFDTIAASYHAAKHALADANARLEALAAQRSTAMTAVQAARGSEVSLNQARAEESGQLGAQIESLSEQLARRGATVDGSGRFTHPLAGVITSPFGMRFHPILHVEKLHTGTDFAGSSVIHAADDGRVIMTILSTAYGNFTVIDHGMVGGKHITTAYAHQSRFLVHAGQVVHKGEPIGIVGATGYATGPHLHFEVREDGTVVDPMPFLR